MAYCLLLDSLLDHGGIHPYILQYYTHGGGVGMSNLNQTKFCTNHNNNIIIVCSASPYSNPEARYS